MRTDVLVIGGGMAGAVAAAAAADLGAAVVCVRRGLGATAQGTGTVDLAPDLLGRPGEAALAATGLAPRSTVASHVERLLSHRPLHPYSVLGLRRAQVTAAVSFLMSGPAGELLAWRGEDRPPFLVPTAAGFARAADLCPAACAPGDLRGLVGTRVAVADLGPCACGWDARLMAAALGELVGEPGAFTPVWVHAAETGAVRTSPVELALRLDRDGGGALAAGAAAALRGGRYSHLMLPPLCGLDRSSEVLRAVAEATGTIAFEALPAAPPSVPGLRLQRALDRHLENAGVTLRPGLVEGFEAAYGRVTRVHVSGDDPDFSSVEPRTVALCTGRYLGGGLRWERRPAESVFGLPVRVGEAYPESAPPGRFALPEPGDNQPAFAAGVTFGDDLRPLGPGGDVAYANLYGAGSVLAGHDDGAERGGTGVALVTGWVTGRSAARAAARVAAAAEEEGPR